MKIIRDLVARGRYTFSIHTEYERMPERGFDVEDALKIVKVGEIQGNITRGKNPGEWKCVVVGRPTWASRDAGVVTVVIQGSRLRFVTIEWMDP